MRMHSTDYAVARCLSVRLFVTRRYCVETAKQILKQFLPPGIGTLFRAKPYANIPTGSPQRDMKKIAIFDQYLALSAI